MARYIWKLYKYVNLKPRILRNSQGDLPTSSYLPQRLSFYFIRRFIAMCFYWTHECYDCGHQFENDFIECGYVKCGHRTAGLEFSHGGPYIQREPAIRRCPVCHLPGWPWSVPKEKSHRKTQDK